MESTRPSSGGLFYGWWLAGIAALVMIIGTVPLFQGMTVWFVVLEHQFGWSRTQLSGAFSLTRVEGSIMGPIGGYLIDR
ncbi:MAG: MFS transporter, partial [Dehalococcoidia bacterium]